MGQVRATRVFGPQLVVGGTTVLPTPPVGRRWKIDSVLFVNPGATDAAVQLEASVFPAAALPFLKVDVPAQAGLIVSAVDMVINATDRFECDVAALDNAYLTINAFELLLP